MFSTVVFPTLRNRNRWASASAVLLLVLLAGTGLSGCNKAGTGVAEGPGMGKSTEDVQPVSVESAATSVAGRRGDRSRHRESFEKQRSADAPGALTSSPGAGAAASSEDELFSAVERMERKVAAAMARVRESVVALEYTAADSPVGARRVATGVVISPQGEVLSIRIDRPPSRVVSAAGKTAQGKNSGRVGVETAPIIARDASGRRHLATWVAADPETGLTLLRIPPKVVRPVRVASAPPKLGSSVFVVGNPFGLGHSVSRGHVAGLDRALELGPRQLGGLTQVQVPLYPGDSGATVANLRGEWLGLIRGGLAPASSAGSPGGGGGVRSREDDPDRDGERDRDHDRDIGFAIPARDAIWVADQLRSSGRVDRAYLGVRLDMSDGTEIGPDAEGARLSGILADSPAAAAGLQAGDRIVGLDRHPIRSASDLTDRLDRIRAQTPITLSVLRHRDRGGSASASPASLKPGAENHRDASNADVAIDRIEVTLRAASRPSLASSSSSFEPRSEGATPIVPRTPEETLAAIRRADADVQSGTGGETVSGAPGRSVISKTSSTIPVSAAEADRGVVINSPPAGDPVTASAPVPKARPASAVPVSVSVSVPVAESTEEGADSAITGAPGAVPLRSATVSSAAPSSPRVVNREQAPSQAQRPLPLPLESQAASPRPADLEPISPRAVIDRLDRLERRLDRLERREQAAPTTSSSSSTSRSTTDKTRD